MSNINDLNFFSFPGILVTIGIILLLLAIILIIIAYVTAGNEETHEDDVEDEKTTSEAIDKKDVTVAKTSPKVSNKDTVKTVAPKVSKKETNITKEAKNTTEVEEEEIELL